MKKHFQISKQLKWNKNLTLSENSEIFVRITFPVDVFVFSKQNINDNCCIPKEKEKTKDNDNYLCSIAYVCRVCFDVHVFVCKLNKGKVISNS